MTSTLSATAAVAFSNRQPTGHVSSHVHTTPLATGVSLLPFRRCWTIYSIILYLRQDVSCGQFIYYLFAIKHTSSNDNWKHFCSWLTDHDASRLFAYWRLRNTLRPYLLTSGAGSGRVGKAAVIPVWNLVWRRIYECDEIWAVDYRENSLKLLPPDVRF